MTTSSIARIAAFFSFTVLAAPLRAQEPPPGQGPNNRLTVNAEGEGGNASSGRAAISSNARIVVFESNATNLVPLDPNQRKDIFLRNQKTGEIRLVSVGHNNMPANGESYDASVSPESPNGFVAISFTSAASNLDRLLARPDLNAVGDIYLNLPVLNFTTRATIGVNFSDPDGPSGSSSVTIIPEPDRVVVAFASEATNIISGDGNGLRDIFMSTLLKPGPKNYNPATDIRMRRVSSAGGVDANGSSNNPRISGDGRFVAFESSATNLVPGLSVSGTQIYLYDVEKETISLVSKTADGTPGNGDSVNPSISFSGGAVAYKTAASNILNDGITVSNGTVQFVRFDTAQQSSTRINVTSSGLASDGIDSPALTAELNPNGRLIIFADSGSNLSNNDGNGRSDIFVKDTETQDLFRISNAPPGEQTNGDSRIPSFGQRDFNSPFSLITFLSGASNLVAGDDEGFDDNFITEYRIPPRGNMPGLRLEVPPDIAVSGQKVKLTLESYSGVQTTAARRRIRAIGPRATTRTRYQVTVKQVSGSSSTSTIRAISKRATYTFLKLSSGTYTAKYRTLITSGSRVVSRSSSSPAQRFTVD